MPLPPTIGKLSNGSYGFSSLLGQGLQFRRGSITLSAYTNADWAGDPDDRWSTSGFCVYLGPNLISWSAKKQPTIARSSTEAEYRSLAHTFAELFWIRALLKDLGLYLRTPPIIWCDNISAIHLAVNPIFHARTKHIEVDYHYVREQVVRRALDIRYINTADQVADIFTKGLSTARFKRLRDKLNVTVAPLGMKGCDNIQTQSTPRIT